MYKYSLEKGSKKHNCPNCGKRTFVRYIALEGNHYVSEQVGRCDREVKCGFHLPPTTYFKENPSFEDSPIPKHLLRPNIKKTGVVKKRLPRQIVHQTLRKYEQNHFAQFLMSLFHKELAFSLMKKYQIGTAQVWPGANIFWQIDEKGEVRTGKVMLYDSQTGKRVKQPQRKIDWVHAILLRKKHKPNFLSDIKGKSISFELEQCFFGLHLLREDIKEIAIVESEKTAILMSVLMPKYLWLASGGLSNLKPSSFIALQSKNVTLFPDVDCYEKWFIKAETLRDSGYQIEVSDFLEKHATKKDRANGLDLADFFIKRDPDIGWAMAEGGYPLFWDY
jgi:predicted RNA-binding Zn-ribbon protein involved in translation (DUF1610 family)